MLRNNNKRTWVESHEPYVLYDEEKKFLSTNSMRALVAWSQLNRGTVVTQMTIMNATIYARTTEYMFSSILAKHNVQELVIKISDLIGRGMFTPDSTIQILSIYNSNFCALDNQYLSKKSNLDLFIAHHVAITKQLTNLIKNMVIDQHDSDDVYDSDDAKLEAYQDQWVQSQQVIDKVSAEIEREKENARYCSMTSIGNMVNLTSLTITSCSYSLLSGNTLILSESAVTNEFISDFVEVSLQSGQQLQSLDVSGGNITSSGAYSIAQLLTIRHLNISDNYIGDLGFQAFSATTELMSDIGDSDSSLQFELDDMGGENPVAQKESLPNLISLQANNTGLTNKTNLRTFNKEKLQSLSVEENDIHIKNRPLFNCVSLRDFSSTASANQEVVSTLSLPESTQQHAHSAVLYTERKPKQKVVQAISMPITLVPGTLFVTQIIPPSSIPLNVSDVAEVNTRSSMTLNTKKN